MTKCFVSGDTVLNVGDWDYGRKIEVFEDSEYPSGFGKVLNGFWVENPLPPDAVEVDIGLAFTAEGRIVKEDSPMAVEPYSKLP